MPTLSGLTRRNAAISTSVSSSSVGPRSESPAETGTRPGGDPYGHGEHSVEARRHDLERYVDAGGIAAGAFSDGRLAGIGVVVPHLRPEIAQLAFLHVSMAFRATGIGRQQARICC